VLARRLTMYAHSFIVRTMTSEANKPSDHADIVREALCYSKKVWDNTDDDRYYDAALAALDALEAERDEAREACQAANIEADRWCDRADRAEMGERRERVRAEAAEAERDSAIAQASELDIALGEAIQHRANVTDQIEVMSADLLAAGADERQGRQVTGPRTTPPGTLFAALARCAADDRYSDEFIGGLARQLFNQDPAPEVSATSKVERPGQPTHSPYEASSEGNDEESGAGAPSSEEGEGS
jgi:hypothetical protein